MVKTLKDLAVKSILESGDSILLNTSNGGGRITKANAERWIWGMIRKNTSLSIKEGDWIRVAAISTFSDFFKIMVTHAWTPTRPYPLSCDVAIPSETRLQSVNVAKYENPSFKAIRTVKGGFVEIQANKNMQDISCLIISCCGFVTPVEASISTATDSDVLVTEDLTVATANIMTLENNNQENEVFMQTSENQINTGGGYRLIIRQRRSISLPANHRTAMSYSRENIFLWPSWVESLEGVLLKDGKEVVA